MINVFFALPLPVQALFASLFTWFMTALGGALVFFSKSFSEKVISFMTAISAGIMIAASFFSLLLPAFSYETTLPTYLTVSIGFLLGGLFIPIFDYILSFFLPKNGTSLLLITSTVAVHNIPEGMAIGVGLAACFQGFVTPVSVLSLILGIALQNFPEGLCVAFPLKGSGVPSFKAFTVAQLTGLVEVFACVLASFFASFSELLLPWVLSFSAGAMITVVSSELIPSCFERYKISSSIGVILGFVFMMFLDIFLS